MTSKSILNIHDIIKINSSDDIFKHLFLVVKITNNSITIVDIKSKQPITLNIDSEHNIKQYDISSIEILKRKKKESYALKHNFISKTWIALQFSQDTIYGKIVELKDDIITVRLYPNNEIIYIDFNYTGLPTNIPLKSIKIISKDEVIKKTSKDEETAGKDEETADKDGSIKSEASEEDIFKSKDKINWGDSDSESEEEVDEELKDDVDLEYNDDENIFLDQDDIEISDEIETLKHEVILDESKKIFSLEKQVQDLLNNILLSVPNKLRTTDVMNNIYTLLNRYKQLKEQFLDEDHNNKVILRKKHNKPLIDSLKHLSKKKGWIIPVVENKKTIFCNNSESELDDESTLLDTYDDINISSMIEARTEESEKLGKERSVTNDSNKYKHYLESVETLFNPYTNKHNNSSILNTVDNKQTPIEVVLDNITDNVLESTAINDNVLSTKLFQTNVYDKPLQYLVHSGLKSKHDYNSVDATNGDKVPVKNYMTLGEKVFNYYKVLLPKTNIYRKTILNNNYCYKYSVLNENKVNTLFLNTQQKVRGNFFKHITLYAHSNLNNIDNYLNKIIPDYLEIFNHIKKTINFDKSISIKNILEELEGFDIYEDNLKSRDISEFNLFINERINIYKKEFLQAKQYFSKLSTLPTNYDDVFFNLKNIVNLKSKSIDLYKILVEKGYNLYNKSFTDSELLNNFIKQDRGELFYLLNSLANLNLISEIDITKVLEETLTVKSKSKVLEKTNSCNTQKLVKKYYSLQQLENDNNKEIYYDKELDTTDYEIIKEYNNERAEFTEQEFKVFLIGELENKIGLTKKQAILDAEALILQKRRVSEKEYCVLIDEKNITFTYYKRENNIWVKDDSIPAVDYKDNEIFCNSKTRCIKSDTLGDCSLLQEEKEKTEEKKIKTLLKNIDTTYELSKNDLDLKLRTKLSHALLRLRTNQKTRISDLVEKDKNKSRLGNTIDVTERNVGIAYEILHYISNEKDFIKRQNRILEFVHKFTRKALVNEDKHWYYNKENNKKILPTFVYDLAKTWLDNKNYILKLEEICKKRGTISDDGDCWVDKYSGYKICDIQFDNDEGYDTSGFKISTKDLLDQELQYVNKSTDDDVKGIDKNEDAHKVYKNIVSAKQTLKDIKHSDIILSIINAIYKQIEVDLSNSIDFIVNYVSQFAKKNIKGKEQYERFKDIMKKKNKEKKIPEYEQYFHESLFYFTIAFVVVSLQTSIPEIKTKKTFPGCIKSFTGYPLIKPDDEANDETYDVSGIDYICCVVKKISSSISPWNYVKKVSSKKLSKQVFKIMKQLVAVDEIVLDKIRLKKEYLETKQKDSKIDNKYKLSKWTTFFPPLIKFNLSSREDLDSGFYKQVINNISHGNSISLKEINIIKHKITENTLEILKEVDKIANKNKLLLKNNSYEPYLENSCCLTKLDESMLQYLYKENKLFISNVETIQQLSDKLHDIEELNCCFKILNTKNTKLQYEPLSDSYSEETIYSKFIQTFNFDNDLDIPENLLSIVNNKPKEYNIFDSLYDKISSLRRQSINFSTKDLDILLDTLGKKNSTTITRHEELSLLEKLRDIISTKDKEQSIFSSDILKHFDNLLQEYNGGVKQLSSTSQAFYNILSKESDKLWSLIKEEINSSHLNKKQRQQSIEFIETINKWKNIDTNEGGSLSNQMNDMSIDRIIDSIKFNIDFMNNIIPNMLLSKKILDFDDIFVPKYWNLANRHVMIIKNNLKDYYKPFKQFTNKTSLIKYLLSQKDKLSEISEIVNHLKNSNMKGKVYPNLNKYIIIELLKYLYYLNLEVLITNIEEDDDELYKDLIEYIVLSQLQFNKSKNIINYSKIDIKNLNLKSKEKEKDMLTKKLQELSDEERKVQKLLKAHKLEDWNVGLQKGLTTYDPKFYEKELSEQEMIDMEIEKEEYSLDQLPEDDDYGEDKEGDDHY